MDRGRGWGYRQGCVRTGGGQWCVDRVVWPSWYGRGPQSIHPHDGYSSGHSTGMHTCLIKKICVFYIIP